MIKPYLGVAQGIKYDNMLSASIGYSWGPAVTRNKMQVIPDQHLVSLGLKLYGVLIQCDIMETGEKSEEQHSTVLLKVGTGFRAELDDDKLNALAFTPYLGYAWYTSKYSSGVMLREVDKAHAFVYGARISYYRRLFELNLDISNRNVGISVGVGFWGW